MWENNDLFFLNVLVHWRSIAQSRRDKRDTRMLVAVCAIEALYRRCFRQLSENVFRKKNSRKSNFWRKWKFQFNLIINERILFHKLSIQSFFVFGVEYKRIIGVQF